MHDIIINLYTFIIIHHDISISHDIIINLYEKQTTNNITSIILRVHTYGQFTMCSVEFCHTVAYLFSLALCRDIEDTTAWRHRKHSISMHSFKNQLKKTITKDSSRQMQR
jgi:hypothetical protein